ncbi:hypothetical protein D3A95_07095 [Thermosynechococcus sichuanensis E542]|uniref:Uncharacterized protein n=1 Tax=Thermosynechococcus sichuanensis E542 TaxID=2016101 RepID=A0A3B7MBG9_9CYAN|nr:MULTISPECIES: hypothetical protein [Thermosynechococcus]AXY67967.2 hypothetical protein D3A95_07095 [Thermosynechococcus vestitus E542]WJI27404.1 hypothetical protein M0644_04175 [Thermosynechococcus sp. B1]WJI29936.1 hypothetical protein M0646_04185 [Thermosynechococcus sp. B3]WNC59444.1 hypothetical protein RHJ80_08130 [Thermosynechococcus sp. QS41]
MSQSPLDAFFLGRATATLLRDQAQHLFVEFLSQLGRFDAEQQQRLHQFMEEVQARARQEAEMVVPRSGVDWQALIDDLRAEIAALRTELQRYRNRES